MNYCTRILCVESICDTVWLTRLRAAVAVAVGTESFRLEPLEIVFALKLSGWGGGRGGVSGSVGLEHDDETTAASSGGLVRRDFLTPEVEGWCNHGCV